MVVNDAYRLITNVEAFRFQLEFPLFFECM